MGRQPDGSFLVSTGQRVEGGSIAFPGRPIDLALHPRGEFFAILNKTEVFLADARGVRPETIVPLGAGITAAGFRGLVWSPDGTRLFASTTRASPDLRLQGREAHARGQDPRSARTGPRATPSPAGMAITRDGTRLFVAAANRNAVVEVDLTTRQTSSASTRSRRCRSSRGFRTTSGR